VAQELPELRRVPAVAEIDEAGALRVQEEYVLSARDVLTWRIIVNVSGERPVFGFGAAAGAQNRTVEVEAKPLPSTAYAKTVHDRLRYLHGHTGPAFIRRLLRRVLSGAFDASLASPPPDR
jgi:hypothetical protein